MFSSLLLVWSGLSVVLWRVVLCCAVFVSWCCVGVVLSYSVWPGAVLFIRTASCRVVCYHIASSLVQSGPVSKEQENKRVMPSFRTVCMCAVRLSVVLCVYLRVCVVLCCVVLCCVVFVFVFVCSIVLCCVVLCCLCLCLCVLLYCIVLCCAVVSHRVVSLCCAVLSCLVSCSFKTYSFLIFSYSF